MSALADLRRAMRSLARRPWFAVAAIASLAFGIGANATVFTIVNGLLFRPLPYPDSDRLVFVRSANTRLGVARGPVTLAELDAIRSRARSLGSVGVFREGDFNLTLGDQARRVRGAVVSAATLRAVRIGPAMGAAFSQDDDRPGGTAHVLVSDALWRSALGAAAEIGRLAIRVDGSTYQVAGVMPPGFHFPERADVWIPLGAALPARERTLDLHARTYQLVARLAADAPIARARAELVALAQALDAERPAPQRGWTLTVLSAESERGENARTAVYLLFALVTCVLLVVCANLASLLVIRAAAQRRELAIRSALGATHGRLVWHGVTESVILAAGGGLLAMVVAVVGVHVVRLAFPADTLPFWLSFEIDWRVLAYSLGLAAGTAGVAGLLPALRAARRAPGAGLSSSSRSATDSAERGRLGAVLVAGQVAVSLVLLVAAALLGAALGSMHNQDLGYDPRGLLTTGVEPRSARYADSGVRRTYFLSLAEQLQAIPGVHAVSGFDLWGGAPIEIGRENGSSVSRVEAPIYTVLPSYFETLRIRVRAGRAFGEPDGIGATPAAVVNETFARRFWPDEQAVGKRVRITGAPDEAQWLTVVGVVADVRRNPADLEWEPHLYLPASQFPPRRVQLVVRAGSASIPTRALTDAARAADPDEPLGPILTMDQQIGVWTAPARFFTTSLGGFAVVALLIAIAGVYGVVSGGVTARTREFGIRLALGATPRHIVGIAVRRGARLAVSGAAVGLVGGVAVAQVLTALPFGVERVDPRLVALAATALVLVALLAAYRPARRAGRLQPTVALGDDA